MPTSNQCNEQGFSTQGEGGEGGGRRANKKKEKKVNDNKKFGSVLFIPMLVLNRIEKK
jgi:hypothetical protein